MKTNTATSTSALAWFAQSAIILALIPFIGYWYSLAFEQGFFSYFGIPYYFVSLNPTLVLSTSIILHILGLTLCISIVPLFVLVYAMMDGKYSVDNKYSNHGVLSYKRVISIVAIFILYILASLIINPQFRDIKILLTAVLIVVIDIALYVIYNYYIKGIIHSSLLIFIFILVSFIILGLGFNLFNKIGREEAKMQENFPVLVQSSFNSEVAIIRIYGDYLYAIPFNRDTKKFVKKLFIIKIPDVKTPLSFETVGPLQPLAP
jgi:hypothetical protein